MDKIIQKLNDAGLVTAYKSITNGGEHQAPCPYCEKKTGNGGKDRLCIWPQEQRAWCRRCEWHGSVADLFATVAQVSRTQAIEILGIPPENTAVTKRSYNNLRVSPEMWNDRMGNLAALRAEALFEKECTGHLNYLRERGLTEETIRAARLGGCFEDRYYDREKFGLGRQINADKDAPQKFLVPEGILIPHFDFNGDLQKIQIRCSDTRFGAYHLLPGSNHICMTLCPEGEIHAVIVVEAALDAILCHQEVPQGFAFMALGSASYRPDRASSTFLRNAPRVLVATDNDEAGTDAYWRIAADYHHANRLIIPPDLGKDVGEAFLKGMNINDWCEIGLELAKPGVGKSKARRNANASETSRTSAIEITDVGLNIPYRLITSHRKAKAAVEKLLSAEYVAIDLETAPFPQYMRQPGAALDPWRSQPRLAQAASGTEVYVFDLNKIPLQEIAPLFHKDWIAHNAIFDYKHLLQAELDPEPVRPFCTMLCDNTLTNQNRSLADLFQTYFGITLDKSLQDSDWSAGELCEEQLQYAARDAVAALRLWERLQVEVTNRDRSKLAYLLHDAQRAVALMELNGIGFDVEAHTTSMKSWRKERKRAVTALRELAGAELNPNSPSQLATFLESQITKAQLRAWPRTKSGQLCTAAKEIAAFRDVAAVDLFLNYRHWTDLVGKFGTKLAEMINPVTGRLHPHFHIGGARTGRMSASAPNVQGLPRDVAFRQLFIPQPGHVLVRADYNQMQLRVAAILSGDVRLLNAYEKGKDVHRLTAARVLEKNPKDITGEERSLAKAIAFGILFGIGPDSLRNYALSNYGVNISVAQAGQVRDRFFETYPDVRCWQLEQVEEAQNTGCVRTPLGRVRNFTREDKENFHTAAMNTPIQGAEGEVMLAALVQLPEALDRLDGLLVNCVHDEILVECPEERAEDVKAALRDCMERGMQYVFPEASLKGLVEVGHGPTWADAK